jgi:hypothetical protein
MHNIKKPKKASRSDHLSDLSFIEEEDNTEQQSSQRLSFVQPSEIPEDEHLQKNAGSEEDSSSQDASIPEMFSLRNATKDSQLGRAEAGEKALRNSLITNAQESIREDIVHSSKSWSPRHN